MEQIVHPQRVTIAREARGLTQIALAEKMNVRQSTISKVESGLVGISDGLLDSLATALAYPRQFLLDRQTIYGLGLSPLYHRKRYAATAKALKKTYARISIKLLQIENLLRSIDVDCRIPRFNIEDHGNQVADIARAVRARWMVPQGPIHSLVGLIEGVGGIVVNMDFDSRHIDGVSVWPPSFPGPVFFLNVTAKPSRYRWTLVHELGHLVMHGGDVLSESLEDEANRFAAEFLMPSMEIRSQLHTLSIPKLADLKVYWKASMQAIVTHAAKLNRITRNEERRMYIRLSKAGYRRTEPMEDAIPTESPQLLRKIVGKHQKELHYSVAELCEITQMTETEFRREYLPPDTHLRLVTR